MKQSFFLILFCSFSHFAAAQEVKLLDILEEEINREMEGLQKAEYPPYYIDYRVNETETILLSATFGSLTQSHGQKARILTTNVKVGDYSLDNTHELNGGNPYLHHGGGNYGGMHAVLPIENEPDAIKQLLWRATNQEYQQASEAYKAVKNQLDNEEGRKESADFSKEKPTVYIEQALPEINTLIDRPEWEKKVKRISAVFQDKPQLLSGSVSLTFSTERKYFISTEGSKLAQNMTYAFLSVSADILAEDGDVLPLYKTYFAFTPEELPGEEKLIADVKEMIDKLERLRKAPLAEPYSGPAILAARPAGVFFHEIFGHRIEGHRLKSDRDGQTFLSKVNDPVLFKTMSVTSDPSLRRYEQQDLIGSYKYDDQGVKGQKVKVVDKGVLKSFLMSRSPLEEFSLSNGHGRASAGLKAVSRQSNLIIETAKPVSMDKLREMLIKACKKQGKSYGYLFTDVTGGFTNTDRYSANVFNIMPTEVYRIYVDGRPDELVRGVDLIGTPLAMFAEIKAGGDKKEVFTGICGAESGSVPVSAVAPALFVQRIETQKKVKNNGQPSLLSRPGTPSPTIK